MSRRPTGVVIYPEKEEFVWREWAVPVTLAAIVVSIVVARAALTPAPVVLNAPAAAPVVVARPVQQVAVLAPPPPPSLPVTEPVTAPGVQVTLRSEGTTWVEASPDGAEQRRYELGPGENLVLAARERISLSLGDAGLIRLKVNDRELGFIGDKGEEKTGLSFAVFRTPPAAAPPAVAGD